MLGINEGSNATLLLCLGNCMNGQCGLTGTFGTIDLYDSALRITTNTESMVKGDKVNVSGFGIFEVKNREARVGRNPRTKETIQIPATRLPAFKASKTLKDSVAK